MTTRATPAVTQPPPSPPGYAIPDDLVIARWIDTGDLSKASDWIDTFGGLLEDMWGFAMHRRCYPDRCLFAAADGRLYVIEGCVFGRRARPDEEKMYGWPQAASTPRPFAPASGDAPLDQLGIADLFCPGLFNPAHARTVGELKQDVWRNILRIFGGSPPPRPVVFVGEDGALYVVEYGLRVRPARALTLR